MLQNKIYLNFTKEILKNFLIVLLGLSIIAITVRAVNFLELIVDSGYSLKTYFYYSFLNLFGLAPKFIPLSFLIALSIFILKHLQDGEFVILWTSGVKKIKIVNLFLLLSIIILCLYLLLSTIITPFALNKSRQLLSKNEISSFLPTVRSQQFSDSFKGFTFIMGEKKNNEIREIFLFDKGANLKNLSANFANSTSTTIIAENGLVEKKMMYLFNGQIISAKKNNKKNEIIKFEQLNIDLKDLSTAKIKSPKIQETSTANLIKCFSLDQFKNDTCKFKKKEIIPTLNRRITLSFYIPIITLICSLLLIKTKKVYFYRASIFIYSLAILLFTELTLRYTGLNDLMKKIFILTPFILSFIFYPLLLIKFAKETRNI